MEAYVKLLILAVILGLAIGSVPTGVNGDGLCRMTKDGLTACQPAVAASNPSPPSTACCSALSKADLQCFCVFKNSRVLSFYGIDFNQAMQLPAKCNLGDSFHC